MQRITSQSRTRALFDVAATRRIEARALADLAPHALMQRAGEAVARLALALAPHAACMRVLCGPGNNGGDGFVAATRLRERGVRVEVQFVGDAAALPSDAQEALRQARAAGVPIAALADGAALPLGVRDLAIDALLGIGARRAPADAIADAIRQLNALPCPVLAVDVPTGLDVDTGQPLGADCVVAANTLSLLTLKPGLFTAAGRDHAGSVWLDDLGVDTAASIASAPTAWLAGVDPASCHPPRRHVQHKGSFADLAVLGGAVGMTGAALLAARAAHAAGAGRVFVELLDGGSIGQDVFRPELMFRPGWVESNRAAAAAATMVCGCGGGEAVRTLLPIVLAVAKRLVLDADALNAIAADAPLITLLRARAERGLDTVLTPHPLEAARLLGCTTTEVQGDRLRAAARLAERCAAVVVLKGSGTVVCAPGRAPSINPTGNASLASAGTGDVLAGWLGGSWSQQGPAGAAFEAAVAAVRLHGLAADCAGQVVLRAAELIDAMARLRDRLAATQAG